MSLTIVSRRLLVLCAVGAVWILPAAARQDASPARPRGELDALLNATTFRNIGPFRTSAWVTEIAVPETPRAITSTRSTRRRAAAACGRRPTTASRGTPISDSVDVAAVGAVAVAPSNSNDRLDGHRRSGERALVVLGQGRLQVHRRRQDLAAHGTARLATTSRASSSIRPTPTSSTSRRWATCSRGTRSAACSGRRDGGKTWEKVLYVNDGAGAIDLVINRKSPDTLYAAMYEKHRTPWQLVLGGPGSGVYRTDDGGDEVAEARAACRPATSAASASTSSRRTRTSSRASSRT